MKRNRPTLSLQLNTHSHFCCSPWRASFLKVDVLFEALLTKNLENSTLVKMTNAVILETSQLLF